MTSTSKEFNLSDDFWQDEIRQLKHQPWNYMPKVPKYMMVFPDKDYNPKLRYNNLRIFVNYTGRYARFGYGFTVVEREIIDICNHYGIDYSLSDITEQLGIIYNISNAIFDHTKDRDSFLTFANSRKLKEPVPS